MSTQAQPFQEEFDHAEQLARIRRAQNESDKFAEETKKLVAEERKLSAEALKLARERSLAPVTLVTGLVTGISGGAVIWLLNHFLH